MPQKLTEPTTLCVPEHDDILHTRILCVSEDREHCVCRRTDDIARVLGTLCTRVRALRTLIVCVIALRRLIACAKALRTKISHARALRTLCCARALRTLRVRNRALIIYMHA